MLKLLCKKTVVPHDHVDGISGVGRSIYKNDQEIFVEGETYNMIIKYPNAIDICEVMYHVISGGDVFCISRDFYKEHFVSIKYNRMNLIKDILKDG